MNTEHEIDMTPEAIGQCYTYMLGKMNSDINIISYATKIINIHEAFIFI